MGVFLFASTVTRSVMAVSTYRACLTQFQPPACSLKSFSVHIELTVFIFKLHGLLLHAYIKLPSQ